MVNAIQVAQKAARKAIEATYFGTLTVTERKKEKDERSKLTKMLKWLFWKINHVNCHLKNCKLLFSQIQQQPSHR